MALGYPHPDYLLNRLTEKQLLEWRAYNNIDPIGMGGQKEDLRMGIICSTIVNIARQVWKKKGSRPKMTEPKDFVPNWGQQETRGTKKQTPEEMKYVLEKVFKLKPKK